MSEWSSTWLYYFRIRREAERYEKRKITRGGRNRDRTNKGVQHNFQIMATKFLNSCRDKELVLKMCKKAKHSYQNQAMVTEIPKAL